MVLPKIKSETNLILFLLPLIHICTKKNHVVSSKGRGESRGFSPLIRGFQLSNGPPQTCVITAAVLKLDGSEEETLPVVPFFPVLSPFYLTCSGRRNEVQQHLGSSATPRGSTPKMATDQVLSLCWQPFCDSRSVFHRHKPLCSAAQSCTGCPKYKMDSHLYPKLQGDLKCSMDAKNEQDRPK